MKSFPIGKGTVGCLLAFILLVLRAELDTGWTQESYPIDVEDIPSYAAEMWHEVTPPRACHESEIKPDTGLFSYTYLRGDLPGLGYPYHLSIAAGLDDTLTASTTLYNNTGKAYDLEKSNYEEWFVPRVFSMEIMGAGGLPFRDETQLGYRFRGCYGASFGPAQIGKVVCPDLLTPEEAGHWWFTMDIWNLPIGRYQLCLVPTDKVPAEFNVHPNGVVFENYPAQNLADSSNAYESCFWRAMHDSNFSAAKEWAGRILDINLTSVPGWFLMAKNALVRGDTAEAKDAFDNAIEYLNSDADPAMPDSTKRPLLGAEEYYIDWLKAVLPYERAQLGP